MKKTQLLAPIAALVLVVASTGIFVAAAHADTSSVPATTATIAQGSHPKPAAVGTVTAVSGDSITLTDKMSGTTYTVDATNATIMKMGTPSTSTSGSGTTQRPTPTTITVSDIAVGDTIMVQGTVSGESIIATQIMDGQPPMGGRGGPGGHGIDGTVTSVSGSTLTITGNNGTTYTVDDSAATASKVETMSVSDIAVGDTVGIDGSVSGTSVTANHIMDGIPAPQQQSGTVTTATASGN